LKPNAEYTTGEHDYHYKTDDQGRIIHAETDDLKLTDRDERLPHDSDTPGKQEGDDAGHLIGDRFGGSPEIDNLISQSSDVNRGEYKKMENEWADAIKNGEKVEVKIDVKYEGDDKRPSEIIVQYKIGDGDWEERSFDNRKQNEGE
jgi:predicted ribonuclease toxin of YeeF-YezG toxin-antitoxin module